MLNLPQRELPTVQFRRRLPDFLGPENEECFISFDARAGGSINPKHVELTEKYMLTARVMMRKSSKIEDDEEFIALDKQNGENIDRNRFAALYEACIISWDTNIQSLDADGNKSTIPTDRATFLDLVGQKVPEIADAIISLEKEILAAGKALKEESDETIKN